MDRECKCKRVSNLGPPASPSPHPQKPGASMPFVPGYEEDGMLRSLNITMNEVEFVADNCTKVIAVPGYVL